MTNYTNKANVGEVILPYRGKDEQGREFKPSGFGNLKAPKNKDLEFVVEKTAFEGGGTGHGPHDIYPDGWHVTARQLNSDGTYNSGNKTIEFYQSGCFIDTIKEVPVVRKMRITFVEDAR